MDNSKIITYRWFPNAEIFKEVDVKKPPKNDLDIWHRIIMFESFKTGLTKLEDMFTSDESKSVIITGYPSLGKRTMVRLAKFKTNAKVIYLNSGLYSNDLASLHYILDEVGIEGSEFSKKETLSDTMEAIKKNKKQFKEKFVVVLGDFDQFCKKSQSLLYNLTEMLQANINMSLVGLTKNRDCTENIEKRVKSRMSASFFTLDPPYADSDEYIKFASNLLGCYKFSEHIEQMLRSEYHIKDRTISGLKRFLTNSLVNFGTSNKLIVRELKDHKPTHDNFETYQQQINWLPDLYVLARIVAYCKRKPDKDTNSFKFSDVINWHITCNVPIKKDRFDINAVRTLINSGFIARSKASERVSLNSEFHLLMPIKFFVKLVEKDPKLNNITKNDRIFSLR